MTSLTPTEQATVTRMGIHDEDILRDMETRYGEHVPCCECEQAATVRVRCRCCPTSGVYCPAHHEELRTILLARLAAAWADRTRWVYCANCKTTFSRHSTLSDLIEESGL